MALTFATALGLVLPACAAGYVDVDGSEAAYVEGPPAGIGTSPRYAFHDGYVYDVNGRYYHQHEGRWVMYRHAPTGMTRLPDPRGRAEFQR